MRIERHPGVVVVVLEPKGAVQTVEMTGLGVMSGPTGFAAGYQSARLATFPGDCRVLLWIESDRQAVALADMLTADPTVCGNRDIPGGDEP